MIPPLLRIAALGPPDIRLGDQRLTSNLSKKAMALLIFLALRPDEIHSRDRIADLLWTGHVAARKNLRDVLPQLRRHVGEYVQISYSNLSFQPSAPYWVDVGVLQEQVNSQVVANDPYLLEQVLDLYRGDFLDGFSVRNAPAFDDWTSEWRERLHITATRGLEQLAEQSIQHHTWQKGLAATERLLEMEPWRERGHYLRMRLLALAGNRGAALAQYGICRDVLLDEFGSEPGPAVSAFYQALKTNQTEIGARSETLPQSTVVESASVQQRPPEQPRPLPAPLSPIPPEPALLGRSAEMETVSGWLQDETVRLILLTGVTGVGKSALAASLAHKSNDKSDDESHNARQHETVLWHPLRMGLPSARQIAAWFHATGYQETMPSLTDLPDPQISAEERANLLLDLLNRQPCLLVFDGLEHLSTAEEEQETASKTAERTGERTGERREEAFFFKKLAQGAHKSTVLVTSWDRPAYVNQWGQRRSSAVKELRCQGLSPEAGQRLLQQASLQSDHQRLRSLVEAYDGNPAALLAAAQSTHELYAGDVAAFVADGTPIFGQIHHNLSQQIGRLSPLEQQALTWLSLLAEPVSWQHLRDCLLPSPSTPQFLELCRSLQRRSLVRVQNGTVALPSMVARYCLAQLTEQIYQEVCIFSQGISQDIHPQKQAGSLVIKEQEMRGRAGRSSEMEERGSRAPSSRRGKIDG